MCKERCLDLGVFACRIEQQWGEDWVASLLPACGRAAVEPADEKSLNKVSEWSGSS